LFLKIQEEKVPLIGHRLMDTGINTDQWWYTLILLILAITDIGMVMEMATDIGNIKLTLEMQICFQFTIYPCCSA
jgi:hypothetical protein